MHRFVIVFLLVAACSNGSSGPTPELPVFDLESFEHDLASSGRPTIVNLWASWCIPCRSEAPLLAAAYERFGDRIDFVGIDVQDDQKSAGGFIEEFGISYRNYFDRDAGARKAFGGTGVPITYFFSADGTLAQTHIGVIDDQRLALQLDELLAGI